MRKKRGQSGQAMIEMAFLGFFLMLLAVIIVHYAIFLLTAQRVESLTREGVQAAFHDCRALTDRTELHGCLDTAARRLEGILTHTIGNPATLTPADYTILYSAWEFSDPDPTDADPTKVVRMTPDAGGFQNPIRIGSLVGASAMRYQSASDFDRSNPQRNAVEDNGHVFVVEVFYRYQSSKASAFGMGPFFDQLPLLNHTIYSASLA